MLLQKGWGHGVSIEIPFHLSIRGELYEKKRSKSSANRRICACLKTVNMKTRNKRKSWIREKIITNMKETLTTQLSICPSSLPMIEHGSNVSRIDGSSPFLKTHQIMRESSHQCVYKQVKVCPLRTWLFISLRTWLLISWSLWTNIKAPLNPLHTL